METVTLVFVRNKLVLAIQLAQIKHVIYLIWLTAIYGVHTKYPLYSRKIIFSQLGIILVEVFDYIYIVKNLMLDGT